MLLGEKEEWGDLSDEVAGNSRGGRKKTLVFPEWFRRLDLGCLVQLLVDFGAGFLAGGCVVSSCTCLRVPTACTNT